MHQEPPRDPGHDLAPRIVVAVGFVGFVLAVAALAQPIVAWSLDARWGAGMAAMMVAELVTGREAAFLLALQAGVPPAWVAATSILQNLALAVLLVPAVDGGWRLMGRTRWGSQLAARLHAASERHRERAWSAVGIFLFMLVPFLANGAVVAGLVGRWAGVSWRSLAAAVVAGVVVTSLAWAYAYHGLRGVLEGVHPGLAAVPAIVALVVVVFVAVRAVVRARTSTTPPAQ